MDGIQGTTDGRVRYLEHPGLAVLALKNLGLTIVTLSIYRFWARTRLRQFFWSNVAIDGDPLEYTGTGEELFVGFLIAVAILAPIFVVYAIAQRLVQGNSFLSGLLWVAYIVALYSFIQFARFRSRRYRLSRTLWRGVRAGQSGSGVHFIGLSWLWSLLTVVTLGVATPWALVALERYRIENTWCGDTQCKLEVEPARLLTPWLIVLILLFVPIFLAFAFNAGGFQAIAAAQLEHEAPPGLPHPGAFALLLVTMFAGVPAYLNYRVAAFQLLLSGISIGSSRLSSEAKPTTVIGIVLLYAVGLFGAVIALGLLAGLGLVLLHLAVPGTAGRSAGAAYSFIIFLAYIPAAHLLKIIALDQAVIRHLTVTVSISNPEALGTLAKSTLATTRFGEGLADSFGVADGFDLGAI